MPGKSRKAGEQYEKTAEDLKKAGEDLERAARDLKKKMSEGEHKESTRGKAEHREKPHAEHKAKAHHEKGPEAMHAGKAEPKGKTAKSPVKGAKWIESVDEHEEHTGQSLATRNHDVIMRWAEERKAQPATVEGTEHEGRPGVLRFDFPGYGGGIKAISWDEWFKTFDARELTFLYQEHLKNGNQSNFFKVTSPHREDG